MISLAVDASTYVGTVAVIDGARIVAEGSAQMRGEHQERLMPAVADALRSAGLRLDRVDRVVCGAGPGSFTSLRIAASIAKGLAAGAGKPLHAVPSLALIVAGNVGPEVNEPKSYLAALDALRAEHFVALIEHTQAGVSLRDGVRLVPTADVDGLASQRAIAAVGPGRGANWAPHARGVALMGRAIDASGPVALGDWEPQYGRLAEAQARWEQTHGAALPR